MSYNLASPGSFEVCSFYCFRALNKRWKRQPAGIASLSHLFFTHEVSPPIPLVSYLLLSLLKLFIERYPNFEIQEIVFVLSPLSWSSNTIKIFTVPPWRPALYCLFSLLFHGRYKKVLINLLPQKRSVDVCCRQPYFLIHSPGNNHLF